MARRTEAAYYRLSSAYRADLNRRGISLADWLAGYGRRRDGSWKIPKLPPVKGRAAEAQGWAEDRGIPYDLRDHALRWAATRPPRWNLGQYGTEVLALAYIANTPPHRWAHVVLVPSRGDGPWTVIVTTFGGREVEVVMDSYSVQLFLYDLSIIAGENEQFDYDVSGTPPEETPAPVEPEPPEPIVARPKRTAKKAKKAAKQTTKRPAKKARKTTKKIGKKTSLGTVDSLISEMEELLDRLREIREELGGLR